MLSGPAVASPVTATARASKKAGWAAIAALLVLASAVAVFWLRIHGGGQVSKVTFDGNAVRARGERGQNLWTYNFSPLRKDAEAMEESLGVLEECFEEALSAVGAVGTAGAVLS